MFNEYHKLTEEELKTLAKECKWVTTTNCGWSEYDIARMIGQLVAAHISNKEIDDPKQEKKPIGRKENMDKLDLLNEIKVVESSCCNGDCEYVLIENSEENREILKELGADEEDIKSMDPFSDGKLLDITVFAFEKLDAEWFQPGVGFSYTKKK